MKQLILLLIATYISFVACSSETDPVSDSDEQTTNSPTNKDSLTKENLIICNEGIWQSDNGQLSYYDATTGVMTNKWFRTINNIKLGDTPNDIIQINDTLIAIAVNWSNIIQYIHPDGTACGATENVPNNRRMCTDGNYLYVTSYAHRCGSQSFTKGYVAKIDIRTKHVVATCETGWEPDGIAIYNNKLYIANSGGYAFSEETHQYETTITIVETKTMTAVRTIDTGCINLYGTISQAGKYLCINSGSDYNTIPPRTIILNCETEAMKIFDFPSTSNTTDGQKFYTLGNDFSYLTGETTFYINTIDPNTMQVTPTIYNDAVTNKLKELTTPYDIYISPHTGNIYFTDAKGYGSAGYIYGYTKTGESLFTPQKLYINPAHILAL